MLKTTGKRVVIWTCCWIIGLSAGCSQNRAGIESLAGKHEAQLNSAIQHVEAADSALAGMENPPSEVKAARSELDGAKSDLTGAKETGQEIKETVLTQFDKNRKLETQFWSPVQRRIGLLIGGSLALLGIALVLIRYGKLGGILASVPILGLLIARFSKNPLAPK